MDQMARTVIEFQRKHLDVRSESDVTDVAVTMPSTTASGNSRDFLETKKCNASSDENNVELDWDAFDRDLAAVADVVDKMGRPQASADQNRSCQEMQKLKSQLRAVQRENGEIMKRAILAEKELEIAKK